MLQTKTTHQLLSEAPVSLHGLRFRELLSIDETARPPGGGVPPAVVGPIDPSGYVLDEAAGTIARAVGLDPIWARVVYQHEDGVEAEIQAANEIDGELRKLRPYLQAEGLDAIYRISQKSPDPEKRALAGALWALLRVWRKTQGKGR